MITATFVVAIIVALLAARFGGTVAAKMKNPGQDLTIFALVITLFCNGAGFLFSYVALAMIGAIGGFGPPPFLHPLAVNLIAAILFAIIAYSRRTYGKA